MSKTTQVEIDIEMSDLIFEEMGKEGNEVFEYEDFKTMCLSNINMDN